MKTGRLLLFILLSLILSNVLFYILYKYSIYIAPYSQSVFDEKITFNGKLLEAIFKGLTVITVIFGVFFGYHQLENALDSSINEKIKTAVSLIRNTDKEIALSGIMMLHKGALRSKDYRDNIKSLLVGVLNSTTIDKSERDKFYSFFLLFNRRSIYRPLEISRVDNSNFRNINERKMIFFKYHFINCNFDKVKLDFCTFTNITFDGGEFKSSSFIKSKFIRCNFNNIKFIFDTNCSNDFSKSVFISCTFDGVLADSVNMDLVRFLKGTTIKDCSFTKGSLLNSSFNKSIIHKSNFTNVNFKNVMYCDSRIEYSDFTMSYSVNPKYINDARSIYKSTFKSNVEKYIVLNKNERPLSKNNKLKVYRCKFFSITNYVNRYFRLN
jgi:uncharacterized protein YjbI with pentapeptide repeats